METNPKEYDTRASWTPRQNQLYESRFVTAQAGQQQLPGSRNPGLTQHGVGQKPGAPEKMPRARALALANTLKRWLVIASIVGFGAFGGLVAFHQVGTTASQTSSASSNTNSTSSSSSQNSNKFLNQQGGNTSGTSSSSTSSSSPTPVTGTHTS